MNSKHVIFCLLVLCFAVALPGLCVAEDTETALIVKKIAFSRFKGGIERIVLFCNQSCVPELFSLEEENPRLIMDMKGVSRIQTKSRNVNTGGKLIKRTRSYLDKQTNILRVVLDMEPSKYYLVRTMQDPSGNAYALTIQDDTDSPLSQERRITILRSDPRPGEQEGRPQDATLRPKDHIAVKAQIDRHSVDQGRSQLNNREFAAAVETFTRILAAHPQESLYYRLRGNAYDNLNDRLRAVEDWTHAARLGDAVIQSYLDFLQVTWREASAP